MRLRRIGGKTTFSPLSLLLSSQGPLLQIWGKKKPISGQHPGYNHAWLAEMFGGRATDRGLGKLLPLWTSVCSSVKWKGWTRSVVFKLCHLKCLGILLAIKSFYPNNQDLKDQRNPLIILIYFNSFIFEGNSQLLKSSLKTTGLGWFLRSFLVWKVCNSIILYLFLNAICTAQEIQPKLYNNYISGV